VFANRGGRRRIYGWTGRFARKGLEGLEVATVQRTGAGARERGAPESPVFCGAKNAPKYGFEKASCIC
jgi:hypothetical protein